MNISTSKTVAPKKPGHAAAQAWYACLVERLAMEKGRTGRHQVVSSNVLPIFKGLNKKTQQNFIDAIGALIVDMLVVGEPNIGRWDAETHIKEAFASEREEVEEP